MKKLLALLLSMVMAVSLAAPAFADGPDGPAPDDGWEEAVPISAAIDEDFEWWTAEDAWEDVCEWYPEYTAIFLKEVEAWYAQHADWYDAGTFDEFAEEVGGKEAAYLSLFYDWKWERQEELARNEFITSLGGVPGQVGVMFNGRYIQFPDAVPEVNQDGTMMAPVRTLVEALGGEVSYQDGEAKAEFVSVPKVVCTANGVTVTFEADGPNVEIARQSPYDSGEVETDLVTMPICTYQKNGRIYVPVRFLANIFGCEVGWDSDFQTAILLDREALAAQFDESFTILNRVLANLACAVEEGENYRADLKGGVTFTAFDTLHGNKTYQADFTGKTLLNTEAASGTYSVTLSDSAVDALMERLIGGEGDEFEEDAAILRTVLTSLKGMEIVMNRDGFAWFHAPVVDELSGEDDVWCGFDVGTALADALFAGTGSTTVGTLLAAGMSTDSVMDCSTAGAMAQMMFDIYGDDKFTTSGGTSTLTIGLDDLEELGSYGTLVIDSYGTLGILYDYYSYREYQFTLKVDSKGGASVTCTGETEARYGMPAVRMTMDGSLSDGRASMSLNYHVANAGELKLSLSASRQTTGEKPLAEPPEGANIVDAAELLDA